MRPSSRSSALVKAACAGPRRPSTTTGAPRSRAAPPARGRRRRCAPARRVAGEQPRDVGRDVAVADDHGGLVRQVGREVAVVGVAVVPADERRGGQAAGQVLAGDAERAVRLRAHGVDDRVVAAHEVRVGHAGADLDVAEEPAAAAEDAARERLVQALDLAVVGRDARAQEPPRRGQALDEVDVGPARRGAAAAPRRTRRRARRRRSRRAARVIPPPCARRRTAR